MKLLDYIRGLRKGKEAHRLEKESMKDPFLADAMDGYGQVVANRATAEAGLGPRHKEKESFKETEFVCCHLEHCRLPGNRYRYQLLFPVP